MSADFFGRALGMVNAMKYNGFRPARWRVSVDLSSSAAAVENRPSAVLAQDTLAALAMKTLDVPYPEWWREPKWPEYGGATLRVIATDTLLGYPVIVDVTLPPNSLILEPVA